jgi:hypothetical protein
MKYYYNWANDIIITINRYVDSMSEVSNNTKKWRGHIRDAKNAVGL